MATNGFFGKVKSLFRGKSATEKKSQEIAKRANRKVSMMDNTKTTALPFGWNRGPKPCKKGAFGGTGTGRGRRGMPGRKLAKKMVKAGWNAQKRVMPMTMRGTK
jgi:hypothetical protein